MLNFSNRGIKSGIYSISIDGRVVYIGQSADLHSRALSHRYNILNSQELWYPLMKNFLEALPDFQLEVEHFRLLMSSNQLADFSNQMQVTIYGLIVGGRVQSPGTWPFGLTFARKQNDVGQHIGRF